MGKVIKLLLLVAAVGGLLTAASYAGARFTAGKIVGSKPPLSNRTIIFQGWRPPFEGVAALPGKPRAWIIHYDRTQLPGVRRVTIYVSPTGKLIATLPRDLEARIEAWERAQEPGP